MFATIAVFSMPLARRTSQLASLERFIIPSVRTMPGFLRGTWCVDAHSETAHNQLDWEDEAAARRFQDFLRARMAEPNPDEVTLVSLEVRAIVAHVSAA